MTKILLIISVSLFMNPLITNAIQPKRAILIVIDGLHIKAPSRFNMKNFNMLSKNGVLVEKTCVIMPHHPVHGEYANIHTCSYPNPVMMTGTVFLTPNQKMLQHSFKTSAFIANTDAYYSITHGYQFTIQQSNPDAFCVDQAIHLLNNQEIDFMRIHLQDAGTAGYNTFATYKDNPAYHNIWHLDSPYKKAIEDADIQLGSLVAALEMSGKLAQTLLVVMGDHGQSENGWHPILDEESWLTPLLFHGPGIKKGINIGWADLTDVTPTIAEIMKVDVPNNDGGRGRVLKELIQETQNHIAERSMLWEVNLLQKRYTHAQAELVSRSIIKPFLISHLMLIEREFCGIERILDWKNKDCIENLLQHNLQLVKRMEDLLK